MLLTPDRCLIFPSVDYVRNLVTKHSMKQAIPVVIDCSHIYGADFTAAKVPNSDNTSQVAQLSRNVCVNFLNHIRMRGHRSATFTNITLTSYNESQRDAPFLRFI